MAVMDVQNMIFVEDNLAALMQSVQSSFVKRVVHGRNRSSAIVFLAHEELRGLQE